MLETAAQQNPSNGAWGGGSLSDEEFERAALSFRPSWEVGIDVVASSDSLAPMAPAARAASARKSGEGLVISSSRMDSHCRSAELPMAKMALNCKSIGPSS